MSYSTDTSNATMTRLRALQSSTSMTMPSSTLDVNCIKNLNQDHKNKNLVVIQTALFTTKKQSNSTLKSNHNSNSMMMMMMPSGGKVGRDRSSAVVGEIEPLLSSASTSATMSPMHETYNANTIIVHDNINNNNSHPPDSVHLEMDNSNINHNNRNHNGNLVHSNNQEGDSIHSSNEESSSLLMSRENYMVIRTQTTQISLKHVILLNILALVFVSLNMIFNLLVIAIIHERIPMGETHLPDIAFDILPDHRHFLDIAEYVIIIQTFCIGLLLFFHKHRSTILRRICIIMGVIYFFRGLCMASTQLPLASKNYYCSPQLKNLSSYGNITSLQFVEIITSRVLYMSLGMGLSINGHHTFCGDYIFSGHTVILILTYLIQQEYLLPSRRRKLAWKCIDLIQITMTVTSVICILIARGHYFIDIIIAYFVTTRIFWIYHTLCNFTNAPNMKSNLNHLNRVWWWPVFLYIENIKVMANSSSSMNNHYHTSHHGKNDECHHYDYHHHNQQIQRIFEWPLPWPKRFVRSSKHRTHHHHHQFSSLKVHSKIKS